MLKNNFFYIEQLTRDANKIISDVSLNTMHDIFHGHFPNQPVVPGVCMLQMQREILEDVLESKLQLKEASVIKFLAMLVPTQFDSATYIIEVQINERSISVSSSLINKDVVFLKFKGSYIQF